MLNEKEQFLDDIFEEIDNEDINELVEIINSDESYDTKLSKLSYKEWSMDLKKNNKE